MVSIIIPVVDCLEYTQMCVASIFKHTKDFELVVIDNGSKEERTRKWLVDLHVNNDNVEWLKNEENRGFGMAVNQGFSRSSGEYVCVLNNDVVVTPKWMDWLMEHLKDYDIIGPCSNFVAGKQLVNPGVYDDLDQLERVALDFHEKNKGKITPVQWIIGLCMLMKREVFEEVGGFDTRFGLGNSEDLDFCITAGQKGYRCGIANDVFIHHFGHVTFKALGLDVMAMCKENHVKLIEKWKGIVEDFGQELE